MDPLKRLGLTEKSDDEIHAALTRFAIKWQDKAGRASTERISRF